MEENKSESVPMWDEVKILLGERIHLTHLTVAARVFAPFTTTRMKSCVRMALIMIADK